MGGAGDDWLLGGSDADQMTGGTGDDYYWIDNVGDSATEMDSGGTDRVYVSGVTQYVLPDYVENAQFHYSTLVGNNLDNVLTGMGTFAGGLGNDRYEALDNYADTFLFGRGNGQDVIRSSFTYYEDSSEEDQLDQLVLGTDISPDQVWFQHVGNSLKLSLIGTGDNITIEDWYVSRDDGNNRITQIKLADNHMLLETRVEALVQAMAIFAPPAAGQTTLPQNYQDDLAPLIAANWQ